MALTAAKKGIDFLLQIRDPDVLVVDSTAGFIEGELITASPPETALIDEIVNATTLNIVRVSADPFEAPDVITGACSGVTAVVASNTPAATTFLTVAGLRSNGITFDNESVDVTTKDTGGVRSLLPSAGTTSMSLSASGVFIDDASGSDTHGKLIRAVIDEDGSGNATDDPRAGTEMKLLFGSSETIQCMMLVTSLERTGEHNGEETFSISIENAGTWNYTDS
jgi:TP901-1 family phage major tail protein